MDKYYKIFEDNKDVIIDEIICEFGGMYERQIREVFNNLKIVFESLSFEEWKAVSMGCDRGSLIRRYREYVKQDNLKRRIFNKYLRNELDRFIGMFIDLNGCRDYSKIYDYFMGEVLDKSLIDYFDSKSIHDKDRDRYQKMFVEEITKMGYKVKEIDPKIVDAYIYWREKLARKVMCQELLKNNDKYNLKICELIDDDDLDIVTELNYRYFPCCYKYIKDNEVFNSFVYLPINRLKLRETKSIDVILIHELIHYIQRLCFGENIINEVMVQYKAMRIVERLHNKGIYLFVKMKDSVVYGECKYDKLVPNINIILDNVPGEVINTLIMDFNYEGLKCFFGDSIYQYFDVLSKLNDNYNEENIKKYNNVINEMMNYYLNIYKSNYKKRILVK